jgi:hypothetical protein
VDVSSSRSRLPDQQHALCATRRWTARRRDTHSCTASTPWHVPHTLARGQDGRLTHTHNRPAGSGYKRRNSSGHPYTHTHTHTQWRRETDTAARTPPHTCISAMADTCCGYKPAPWGSPINCAHISTLYSTNLLRQNPHITIQKQY